MLNRRQHKVAGSTSLALEARAGVIFASDYVDAELFAATSRIARAVKAYARSVRHVGDDQAITGILVDLRHYCNSKGLAFNELNAAAEDQYWDEKADLA